MKYYKKGLLTLTVLATMSLMAAGEDYTIYVNTFVDEDGENESKCSLREAVTAASQHKAYGGCPKGQPYSTVTNLIQLEEGEYKLSKELQPNSAMTIRGKLPEDFARPNAITNIYPAAIVLKTTISGQNNSRIFNTTNLNKPSLGLQHLLLKDAKSADLGGALFVGGAVDLFNVSITNANAKTGGAIFLNDINSSLTIKGGEFSANKAQTGSFFAMSCMDNLQYTQRIINLNTSTYISNGAADSQSIFDFCGQPTATINSSTITLNTVNAASGSIIKFHSPAASQPPSFSAASNLKLLSNTIVKNTAQAILAYNAVGIKNLDFNVIGFNNATACRFTDGDVSQLNGANISLLSNALSLTSATEKCELPKTTLSSAEKDTVELAGQSFENLFSSLQPAQESTAFMSLYYPKDNANKTDLVDVGVQGCNGIDQRGITRIPSFNVDSQGNFINTCDIGATELLKLTAKNISETNVSVLDLIKHYQEESDFFKVRLDNKDTKAEFLPFYKIQYDLYQALITNTNAVKKYRTMFIDPFVPNLPAEIEDATGGRVIKHLTADNYDVSVKVEGVGKLDSDGKFLGVFDPNLKCEWNKDLKQIVMYRNDDRLTPLGDQEFCQYTLSLKNSNPIRSSTAYVSSQFINIKPNVPASTDYVVEHGTNQKVTLNLLKDANDNGDGSVSALTNKPNKSPFYLNDQGQVQAIRFVKIPDAVTIKADYQGACPGLDRKETCYGGNITAQLNNSLDVFNYELVYQVYDIDEKASDEGKIFLKNTATAPGSVRTSGGGGSFGWLSLVSLIALGLMRVRSNTKKSKHV